MALGLNYRKLWAASAISNLGDGVRLTALPLLAATLTRDPVSVAMVTLAASLPWLLFALVAGAIADRTDRKRLMVGANGFRALVVGLLGLAILGGFESLLLLIVVSFALGVAETLFDNAAQAFMPALVVRDELERANGRLYAVEMVTNQFVGPPVGGVLYAMAAGLPFLLDAGSFAGSAFLVALIAVPRRVVERHSGGSRPSLRAEIAEGMRWLWSHRLLRTLAVMLGIMNMLTSAFYAIFVLFALEILNVDESQFGLLLVTFAVGAVLGSLLGARVSNALGPGTALFVSVLLSGLSTLVTGLVSSPWIASILFAISGFVGVLWNVITVSLRQSIIPDHLLGRVNSVYRFVGWGTMPVGATIGGVLARVFGLRAPFLVAGVVMTVMAFVALPIVTTRSIEAAKSHGADATGSGGAPLVAALPTDTHVAQPGGGGGEGVEGITAVDE